MNWIRNLKVTDIIQYLLIYLLFITLGSSFYGFIIPGIVKLGLTAVFLCITLCMKKYRQPYVILSIFYFGIIVMFTRILTGGVGIDSTIVLLLPVLVVNCAIMYNKKTFLEKFIKLSIFFQALSLILFVVQLAFPAAFNSIPQYYTHSFGTIPYQTDYYARGFLFFTVHTIHQTRNSGLFTEPGVYQIMVNATIMILLFCRNKLKFSNKQYIRFLVISIVCLLSIQSTTGYIGFLLIAIFYLARSTDYKIKRRIYFLLLMLVAILGIEFVVNGDNSILIVQIYEKLFNGNQLDLANSSGVYRLSTIEKCMDIIIRHPFGVGFNNLVLLDADAGGGIFMFAAVYGVIPTFVLLYLLIYPFIKHRKYYLLVLFLLIFINTTSAQTYVMYPGLIVIPYIFQYCYSSKKLPYTRESMIYE